MSSRDNTFNNRLLIIVVAGFIARIVFLWVFDNVYSSEAEAYSKINLVAAWDLSGRPYPDINFGPLHTWLIHYLTLPFANKVLPVRLFSVICGTLLLWPFAHLVRLVFSDRVALASAILAAFIPVHLRGAATSLAMAPYSLFIILGLYGLFRYRLKRNAKFHWLAFSALFMNLAGMMRFEAWLFLPLMCLFLVRKNFLYSIFYAAMNLVFPLVHLGACYKLTGNPFFFAKTSSSSFLQYMPEMSLYYKLTGWIFSFAGAMTVPLAVCALAGLFYAAYTRKGFHFALLFLFNYGVFQYKTLTNTIDPSLTRYTASMSLLLIPFAANVVFAGTDFLGKRTRKAAAASAVVFGLLAAQLIFFAVWQGVVETIPKDVKQVVTYLRENVGDDEYVMPDSRFHPYFMVESRINAKQFVSLEFTEDRKSLKEDRLASLIRTTPPDFVVLDYYLEDVPQVNSNLDAFSVPKDTKQITLRGLDFTRIAQFGDFVIFRTKVAGGES